MRNIGRLQAQTGTTPRKGRCACNFGHTFAISSRHKGELRHIGHKGCFEMFSRELILHTVIAGLVTPILVNPALADAHAITIEGNGWVVLFILLFFVAVIYFLIIGSMQAEERDGRLGRYQSGHEHGWFGMSGRSKGDDDGDGDDNSN